MSGLPPDLPPELVAALDARGPDELRGALGQVLDLGAARARRDSRPAARQRRRPAAAPFGMTVDVELVGARPPVTRTLDLPSTLRLDQLHDVLQAVFGWDDSHLHRFSLGDSVWDPQQGELFLCPYDVEDGDAEGLPTTEVRLDEVLATVGDALLYVYDYGDEWTHRVVVTDVLPPVEHPRCTGGAGAAPPEDSGGVWEWDSSVAPFDLTQAQSALDAGRALQTMPAELRRLVDHLTGTPELALLTDLLELAEGAAPTVDLATAESMTSRYAWLLGRVGDGLTLTQAGWLPPQVVTEAMTALWPEDRWIGKRNREDLTEPVRALRASAQRLGLLRVAKGRLLVTKAGTALHDDPQRLWRHVAERAPGRPRDGFPRTATALLLTAVAAGRVDDVLGRIASAAGWRAGDGGPVRGWAVSSGARDLNEVLHTTDAVAEGGRATDGGRALARAALAAWNA